MNYITVKLTEDQARAILSGMALYDDYPVSHPENQFLIRIFNKIEKALAKAKNE